MHRLTVAVTTAIILLGTISLSSDARNFPSIRNLVDIRAERAEVLKQCQGKFKDREPTPKELKTVLNDHKVWDKTYRPYKLDNQEAQSDPRRANLCGAILRASTNLSNTQLHYANLSGAELWWVNMSGASLSYANLSGADLLGVNLSGASLSGANLSGAQLSGANLSGAHLSGANLSGALLLDVNLSGVMLWAADLRRAVFEPKDLPDVDSIAYARNLSEMVFKRHPQALVKLRKAFKEAGYYQQEREVTYAIQHHLTLRPLHATELRQVRLASLLEAVFRYVLFDLTCQWGMAPGRPLRILLILILVFAIPYMIALRLPGQNGIWCKWADNRIRLDLGTKEPTRLHVGWSRAAALGVYFSVLSAFNIGWREFNVGNWIQRLQAQEYILKATGWVRTVSGVQSLVSVYLLAIWALTYFGRPFE